MITIVPFLEKVNRVILNPIITLAFAVALVYFIYGVIMFVNAEGKDKSKAKDAVTWGLVGMFIMVSVYGILNLVLATFDIPKPEYLQDKL